LSLQELLREDDVVRPYEEVLLPAVNMFKEVQQRGVFIDTNYLETLAVEWGEKYLADEDELVRLATELGYPGEINLNSPKQLSTLLYQILGLPGGPSTGAKILEQLKDEHPFVRKLMDFRHLDHMYGTYILGIMDDIKADGRVHADVLLHGTVTGRLSYRDPPLQTIPKDYTLGDEFGRIRHIFAAGDDDHVIVEADLSQAEIWSAYGYSRDPQMFADLQSGDYHRQTASTVFNKAPEDVSDLDRYNTKFITFGIMYGREAPSLARGELNCSIPEAQRYLDRWFTRYPIYREWWYGMQQRAIDDGELVSITGRKRRFRLVRGEEAYRTLKQAVNFPIQSSASDAVLTAAVELHQLFKHKPGLDSYVLFLVHDCIMAEVHKAHLEEVLHAIKRTMSRPRFEGFPGIPVDIKVGRTWGEAKKVKVA
jgi:DNA polymerase-1